MIKHLPNLMTLMNLFCGCLAIISLFNGHFDNALLLVVIAGILDFFDGFVARLVKANSDLGKQLDSLADMVTFGVVPGFTLFFVFNRTMFSLNEMNSPVASFLPYLMFVVTLFSCLRLAKFNIDPRQASYFIGLNTPSNTFLVMSLPLILNHDEFGLGPIISNPAFLIAFAAVSSYLLVAEIPFLSFKIKSLTWKDAKPQLLLLIGAVLFLLTLRYAALPIIIVYYLILSLIYPPHKNPTP
jgi:CDP-diacylglycerol---serine O-phosphatidyltransferase